MEMPGFGCQTGGMCAAISKSASDTLNEIVTVRIELRHSDPLIWRQVEVPTSSTLKVLHDIIQAVMGWFDQEVLAGLVERVSYHNAENGFCVLRARARGHRDVVTVVGHAASISAGEWITASGDWVNDRTHGQQFKARFLRTSPPTSADGIEKYLSSGMIRGVGPVYAKKLVRAFGEKVFDIIEATPERLREVDVIGPVRAASILAAWAEQKALRELSPAFDRAYARDVRYFLADGTILLAHRYASGGLSHTSRRAVHEPSWSIHRRIVHQRDTGLALNLNLA